MPLWVRSDHPTLSQSSRILLKSSRQHHDNEDIFERWLINSHECLGFSLIPIMRHVRCIRSTTIASMWLFEKLVTETFQFACHKRIRPLICPTLSTGKPFGWPTRWPKSWALRPARLVSHKNTRPEERLLRGLYVFCNASWFPKLQALQLKKFIRPDKAAPQLSPIHVWRWLHHPQFLLFPPFFEWESTPIFLLVTKDAVGTSGEWLFLFRAFILHVELDIF